MTDKKADKNNDNEQITDIVPQNELDNIFTELTKDKKDSKQSIFYLYWLFGFPVKTCADKAGYAESYGYKLVEKYKKVPKLRHMVDEILSMFPERYKSFCKLRLPQIAEIEGKALQEYEKKPRLAIDKPQLLKQLKQGSGVDLGDTGEVLESLTEKAAIKTVSAVYKLRDMLNGKVKKQFLVVNDALKELEELNPGFLHLLERFDIWETDESKQEVKYLCAYLWASVWRSGEADFYRVLNQISDTIDILERSS